MKRDGSFFSACDCIDGKLRTGDTITACDNIALSGNIELIDFDSTILLDCDIGSVKEVAPFDPLTDRDKDIVCFHCDGIIFIIGRRESAFAIEDGETLLEFDADDLAVFD